MDLIECQSNQHVHSEWCPRRTSALALSNYSRSILLVTLNFHMGTKRADHQRWPRRHPRESTPSITNCVLKMLQLQLNFVISFLPFRVPSSQTFNFPAQAPWAYTLLPYPPPRWLAALL